jgi:hypothetical protein
MRAAYLLLCACALFGQEPSGDPKNLQALMESLRLAMEGGDWKTAAELSSSLKNAVIGERDRTLARDSKEQIDRLIDALPENTETIVVAQQPFTLSKPDPNTEHGALTTARAYILGLLGAADDEKPLKALYGSTLRYAVLAARKFANHPPDDNNVLPLGLIAYQGCGVYAFANLVAQLAFPGPPDSTIAAHQVWTATGEQHSQARDATSRSETYLITFLNPDLILACNDKEFFSSVVTSFDRRSKGTLLQRLPEWKQVDRSVPVWGLRHFIEEASATDPTHPNNGDFVGEKLTGAIGTVLEVDPEGKVRALWLSTSKENPWDDLSRNPDLRGAASARALANGVWELSVNDDVPGAGYFAIFAIMAFLGFAVLL